MNKVIEFLTPYFAPALKWALMALGLFLALWFVHHDGYTKGKAEVALTAANAAVEINQENTKQRNKIDAEVRKMSPTDVDRELCANGWMRSPGCK